MLQIGYTEKQIETIPNSLLSYYDRGATIRLQGSSGQKKNCLDHDLWYHPPPYKA